MSDKINYLKLLFESGQSSESFSEKLNDFFPGLIYVYDLENRKLRYINNRLTDILGFSYDELKDSEDVWMNLVFKEDIDLVRKELEKINSIKDDESLAYGCRLNHKAGNWRYFKTFGTVLRRDEVGKPLSALFIANDITDQLKTEEEAKAATELFRETEELLQFGSWSWDIGTDRQEWTNGMYDLLEYTRKELPDVTSKIFERHVADDDVSNFNSVVKNAIASESEFEFEFVLKTKNGKQKNVLTKAKVVRNSEGKAIKVLGITKDITVLKNLEKERERTFKELNRSNKELEEFAYVASHDLQEPLRKISTFTERLKNKFGGLLGVDGIMYLERIISSTENMRMLIDNLLEFSRTTRSSQAYARCDLNIIVKEVISDLELKIEETKADIQSSALPVIEAVPLEMKQLFNNLINNSIKFRKPESDPLITIQSSSLDREEQNRLHLPLDINYVKIEIQDNGIGFEAEYAERIFQIFQRLHGKAEYAGSGIGLAICKKIVDNHEGIIFGEGTLGNGASFKIILPEKQVA